MLVSAPQDVTYLTGFTGEDSILAFGRGWACLLTDGRFGEQARKECPDLETIVRTGAMSAAIAEVVRKRRVRRLGFQPEHLTVQWEEALAKAMEPRDESHSAPKRRRRGARIVPAPLVVARLRERKDAGEVGAIRRAIRVAERAFLEIIAGGARGLVGKTERQVAAELDHRMRLAGADGPAFPTIVAAGSHASLPHYRPGDRRIRPGQAVLIDWGARLGGYCSDLTRVVFTGRIPAKLAGVYEVVRRAQAAGLKAVRPGVACKSVDAAARRYLQSAGHGRRFLHGLGHGLGLDVHEAPGLSPASKGRLKSGMVVTIEPGVYLPGVGGVRIEDDVLVTPGGRRRLSSLPSSIEAMSLR